jgi:hypothetical protein
MEKEKKPEFVVTDRRKFNADGAPRPDAPVEAQPAATPPAQEAPAAKSAAVETPPATKKLEEVESAFAPELTAETGYDGDKQRTEFGGQKMEFIHLLDMLVQTAMMYAGAMETGTERRVDIVGLRQMIDLINVLEQKTKGNLSEQEQAILTNTVFQLRMTYMEIVNMIGKQALTDAPDAPGAPRK